jgi:hypothetical protein
MIEVTKCDFTASAVRNFWNRRSALTPAAAPAGPLLNNTFVPLCDGQRNAQADESL